MLGHRLPGEHRVPGIDPGIDCAEGDAGAGLRARPVCELDLCPGAVCPDRAQPPLVREVVLGAEGVLDGLTPGLVFGSLEAAVVGRLDAGGFDDGRRRRSGFGSRVRVRR